jgi:hypothetical protein
VNVLREEGLEAVRYFLWDTTGWHRDYDPCLWRNRATEEQKREGWEMWVRMNKILCAVPREAHERQAGETMDALSDGPGRFYESPWMADWPGPGASRRAPVWPIIPKDG